MKIAAVLFALLLCGSFAAADTVTFKNGDKLGGTLVSVIGGKLNLKTDALGQIAIPLDKIQSYTVDAQAVILTKDNNVLRGKVELQPSGEWQVTLATPAPPVAPAPGAAAPAPAAPLPPPPAAGPEYVGATEVNSVLPQTTYHTLAEVPALPWQNWKGNANLGFAFSRGDQDTHSFSVNVNAIRERPSDILFAPHWRTTYNLIILFSEAQSDGADITSNTLNTMLREDYLLSPKNFIFGSAQIDHVDAQGLYLQQSYGAGYGRGLYSTNRTTFSLLGGFNYVSDQYYTIPEAETAQAFVGETLTSNLSSRIHLDEHFNFYPDVVHGGQYRFDGAANLAFKLTSHFTANTGLIDLYLTRVAPGSMNNNFTFTSGLGYSF